MVWTETTTTTLDGGQITTGTIIESIIESTVLTIPPVTTTAINFWNVYVTNATVVYLTTSILPPPFIITEYPTPPQQTGVTPITTTITPPPSPYTVSYPPTPPPSNTNTETTSWIPPAITIQFGLPGPICLIGCGTPCLIFCDHPCSDCGGENGGENGGNGGEGEPEPTTECETTTFTSCDTYCVAATPTSSCSTLCSGKMVSHVDLVGRTLILFRRRWMQFHRRGEQFHRRGERMSCFHLLSLDAEQWCSLIYRQYRIQSFKYL